MEEFDTQRLMDNINSIIQQLSLIHISDKMGLDNFKIVEDGKIRIYDHHISTQELSKVLALNDVCLLYTSARNSIRPLL